MLNLIKGEVSRCVLCNDALCSKACSKRLDPRRIIKALRFKNTLGAYLRVTDSCAFCSAPCEKQCILDNKIKIKDIMTSLIDEKKNFNKEIKEANIETDFCGKKIENPYFLSSSVVSSSYDMVKRAFDMGFSGVSYKTISYIDIHETSPRFSAVKENNSFLSFKNIEQLSEHTVDENLEVFKKLKKNYPNKFLLVSIMGRNDDEWISLAKKAYNAGADALELNFSCPNMTEEHSGSDIGQVPELVKRYTKVVVDSVPIPVIPKLTPNVLSVTDAAFASKEAGALGVSLINTIKSITEFDCINDLIEKDKDTIFSIGGLSGAAVKPIALKFISEISTNKELSNLYISGMGGIYTYMDALMFMSLGCKSLQLTTAAMEYGYEIVEDLIEGLKLYLGTYNKTLDDIYGINIKNLVDVVDRERDIKILPKFLRDKCRLCGRCYISCRDGGHNAISLKDNKPILDPNKCQGCHLCMLVCPFDAIVSSDIKIKKE